MEEEKVHWNLMSIDYIMMTFILSCHLNSTIASNVWRRKKFEENIKSMQEEILLTKCVGLFMNWL